MKAVILDFDGTIADSGEIFTESLEAALGRKQRLSTTEIEELRKSSTREIIQKLGVKKGQLPWVLIKGKREVTKRMDRVQPFDGMAKALAELSQNHKLYILSTNSEANIAKFLDRYKLSGYITKTYANVGLQGKTRGLKKLLARESLAVANCVYVGDETRDIETSKKVGIKCVAVGWGYSHPDTLKAYKPTGFVVRPQDLLKTVTTLFGTMSA